MKKATSVFKFFVILTIPLILIALLVVIIDPFFHYHRPLSKISYTLSDERYQNDGIVKHFEYNAIVTGSSMTQNIYTSEVDKLFNVNSIKVSFAGGSLHEVSQIVETALQNNPNIKIVLRSLDTNLLNYDKDYVAYEDTPSYLYDKNPLNDYKYIYNKEVVLRCANSILDTLKNKASTTFDEYASFTQNHAFGKEAVLNTFNRVDVSSDKVSLSDEDIVRITENINKNIISSIKEYPDVTFILFIPPYSICSWDARIRTGQFEESVAIEELAYNLLKEYENVKVFSYSDYTEITTNLDHYMDTLHYDNQITSLLLEYMSEDKGLLTEDNYKERLQYEIDFYSNYDYSVIFD